MELYKRFSLNSHIFIFGAALLYSFVVHPYTGEYIEWSQNLNGSVIYADFNYQAKFRGYAESSFLTSFFSWLHYALQWIFPDIVISILFGAISNYIAMLSVYLLAITMKLPTLSSKYLPVVLVSVYFGNISAYPLYYPSDFFGWGQLSFYIFCIWFVLWVNHKIKLLFTFSILLVFVHPVFALLAFVMLATEFALNKNKLIMVMALAQLTLLILRYGSNAKVSVGEINWSLNHHHLWNNTWFNILILAGIISLFMIYVIKRLPKHVQMPMIVCCVFVLVLTLAAPYGFLPVGDNIVFRGNFGRFFNLIFLLTMILSAHSAVIWFARNDDKNIEFLYLLLCLPIPIYVGISPIYAYVFSCILLILATALLLFRAYAPTQVGANVVYFSLSNKNIYLTTVIFIMLGAARLGIAPGHGYNGNNEIYSTDLPSILSNRRITQIVTPGLVHGVDDFNVQLATNLPYWVPYDEPVGVYCGITQFSPYQEYVESIRQCFGGRSRDDWASICQIIGQFAVVDFKYNNLRINGDLIFSSEGLVVYDVC